MKFLDRARTEAKKGGVLDPAVVKMLGWFV
jgi:hypothetical protein